MAFYQDMFMAHNLRPHYYFSKIKTIDSSVASK